MWWCEFDGLVEATGLVVLDKLCINWLSFEFYIASTVRYIPPPMKTIQ